MSRENREKQHAESSAEALNSLQMPPDVMLELATRTAEIIIERIQNLPDEQAWDGEFKRELEDQLMEDPPEHGSPALEVLGRAAKDILPLGARLDHPRSFAFIPSAPTWPGILADFMVSAYQVNQCTWLTSSGASQMELVVMDWIRRWLGYPDTAGGLMTSGGSAASLEALVAARESAGAPERGTVYMSDQSHSALVRAARIMGIRSENVRLIPTDAIFRMDPEALKRTVAEDRASGLKPVAVCANAGAASTGAIDPLDTIADFCEADGIWLHVDAAYGGFTVITERGKDLLRGMERADSIGLDAHKLFFQPYEAGCLMVKDLRNLERAFAVRHDILQDTIWGANHPNFSDRGLQLSRSVRALKIWVSVKTFGMAAFRNAVSKGMELAGRAEEHIRNSGTLELLLPSSLGIVCFRVNSDAVDLDEDSLEKINRKVLARIFWEDPALMSSTLLRGRFTLRLCIVNYTTTWDDVRETLEAIERFGNEAISEIVPVGVNRGSNHQTK